MVVVSYCGLWGCLLRVLLFVNWLFDGVGCGFDLLVALLVGFGWCLNCFYDCWLGLLFGCLLDLLLRVCCLVFVIVFMVVVNSVVF